MIDDILKTIDEKAEEEITKILQKKEEALLAMEKEYGLLIKSRQEEEKRLALKSTAKEIKDFEKALQLKLNFQIQQEKNNLVQEIYEKAQEGISNLDSAEFKKLLKHLVSYLPKDKKGHIEAGEKTAKALKYLIGDGAKIENILKEEGFIFKSHDVEIDLRISQVASQLQETANPELIKILFA